MNPMFSSLLLLGMTFMPGLAAAHYPRLVDGRGPVIVKDPEVSKGYYGTLRGEPQAFLIVSAIPVQLYVALIVPDLAGAQTDLLATISQPAGHGPPLAVLDGRNAKWTETFDEFGRQNYLKGPEFRRLVPAGTYLIRVSAPGNDRVFGLATGERVESFGLGEIVRAYSTLPTIRARYFRQNALTALLTPFLGFPLIGLTGVVALLARRRVGRVLNVGAGTLGRLRALAARH